MSTVDTSGNALLAMLPSAVIERVGHAAALVTALPGDILFEPGQPVTDLWFPIDLVISLDHPVIEQRDDEDEGSPGVALIGAEGFAGIEPLLGDGTAANRATVRLGGSALRFPAELMRDEFARAGVLHRLALRFGEALFGQVSGTCACERVHSIQQRLVRWLLLFDDRNAARDLGLTQVALAQLLSVRRVSVQAAAAQLQEASLIAYRRGIVTIADREGLEARACVCYRSISAAYARYLEPD